MIPFIRPYIFHSLVQPLPNHTLSYRLFYPCQLCDVKSVIEDPAPGDAAPTTWTETDPTNDGCIQSGIKKLFWTVTPNCM
ncbi:uncharacterized protein CELE_T07H3.8 [Caenorhabditis elegans]|uniref:Uncharacterized protein n=1 Tax=Caenorhabditis elegans TaxID=6239 RepID=C6S3L6_CAEEL|nr:Uncharacterized protein CELE_T07H3.8 [Caenorhabditis elegans]CCD63703.1 Uncharacterized protein CELE_T07H3.8 [Caenorhabditis elegans]|eukprot:NP_001254033.1 Uncharacterized protein CELE_T07H3.8 [Caenorhabditis elegans]